MADPLSRIQDANASATGPVAESKENHPQALSTPDAFLDLIVTHATDYRATGGLQALSNIQSPLDRLARERVFESIVRKTLDNPEHPYYSLVGSTTRKEMIQRITQLLNSSHYLNPQKRTV